MAAVRMPGVLRGARAANALRISSSVNMTSSTPLPRTIGRPNRTGPPDADISRPGGRPPASAAVEVVAQLLAAQRVAQLGQGLRLDLADALAGDAELLADLLERAGLAVVEAEAEPDDLLLPVRQPGQRFHDRLAQHPLGGGFGGRLRPARRGEVGQGGGVLPPRPGGGGQ